MRARLVYEFEHKTDADSKFELTKKDLKEMSKEIRKKLYKKGVTVDMIEEHD